MRNQNVGFTLCTGPRAGGKTTLLGLMNQLVGTGTTVFNDTSAILDHHIQNETQIGLQLLRLQQERDRGKILPARLVFDAVSSWIDGTLQAARMTHHFFLAGSPRDPDQSRLWKDTFPNLLVVHITTTISEVMEGIRLRQKTGQIRPDESEEAVLNGWNEYQEKVVPAICILNGKTIELPRSMPMIQKLEACIPRLPISGQVSSLMLKRLRDHNHPVAIKVREIDGVKT